jgi:hypothetical protein
MRTNRRRRWYSERARERKGIVSDGRKMKRRKKGRGERWGRGTNDDGKVVLEELVRVAASRGVVGHRKSPLGGVGLVGGDVVGDLAAREEVNRDSAAVPFHLKERGDKATQAVQPSSTISMEREERIVVDLLA